MAPSPSSLPPPPVQRVAGGGARGAAAGGQPAPVPGMGGPGAGRDSHRPLQGLGPGADGCGACWAEGNGGSVVLACGGAVPGCMHWDACHRSAGACGMMPTCWHQAPGSPCLAAVLCRWVRGWTAGGAWQACAARCAAPPAGASAHVHHTCLLRHPAVTACCECCCPASPPLPSGERQDCHLLHFNPRFCFLFFPPQSPAFPMLDKWQEVCAMDYAAAARGRRLWALFQRWLRGRAGACRPLALEMGQRSGA